MKKKASQHLAESKITLEEVSISVQSTFINVNTDANAQRGQIGLILRPLKSLLTVVNEQDLKWNCTYLKDEKKRKCL